MFYFVFNFQISRDLPDFFQTQYFPLFLTSALIRLNFFQISRHLVDHNVNPIPLTWQRSFQLYQYYAPDSLPEFNSYKSQSISADLEQLFKRIIGLIPNVCALSDHLPLILDFINGKTNQVPDCVEFPGRVKAIYYLLGKSIGSIFLQTHLLVFYLKTMLSCILIQIDRVLLTCNKNVFLPKSNQALITWSNGFQI